MTTVSDSSPSYISALHHLYFVLLWEKIWTQKKSCYICMFCFYDSTPSLHQPIRMMFVLHLHRWRWRTINLCKATTSLFYPRQTDTLMKGELSSCHCRITIHAHGGSLVGSLNDRVRSKPALYEKHLKITSVMIWRYINIKWTELNWTGATDFEQHYLSCYSLLLWLTNTRLVLQSDTLKHYYK